MFLNFGKNILFPKNGEIVAETCYVMFPQQCRGERRGVWGEEFKETIYQRRCSQFVTVSFHFSNPSDVIKEGINGVNRYLVCEMSIFQGCEVFFFPIPRCKGFSMGLTFTYFVK